MCDTAKTKNLLKIDLKAVKKEVTFLKLTFPISTLVVSHSNHRQIFLGDVARNLINKGLTARAEIDRVYEVHGHGMSVTRIINAMKKDKKDGTLHALLAIWIFVLNMAYDAKWTKSIFFEMSFIQLHSKRVIC